MRKALGPRGPKAFLFQTFVLIAEPSLGTVGPGAGGYGMMCSVIVYLIT